MNRSLNEVELQLTQAYEAQADQYDRALTVVKRLPGAFSNGEDPSSTLQELADLMHEARNMERQTQGVSQQWQVLQQRPGPDLNAALKRNQSVIEEFLQCLQLAEQAAQQTKDRLLPQLDAHSRGQQMKSAYGAASRHG